MSRKTPSPAFVLVGNHPALDLLNTIPVLSTGPLELLISLPALAQWMTQTGLAADASVKKALAEIHDRKAQGVLTDVKSLREALRGIVVAKTAGQSPAADDLATINAALRRSAGVPQLHWDGKQNAFLIHPEQETDDSAACILRPIAQAVADLLTRTDLSLVRKCENPACVLFFYDTSKNHKRRWCSMGICGNRHKVAAHYRRHH